MRFNRPVKSGIPEARQELAESLREGARDSGLTADRIAGRAHATKGAVSQAMSGTRVPSQSLFRSIVRAIGHDPLSPRWLALYAAALAAVLAAIASIWGGSWLVASVGSEPGPPAVETPVVQVKKNARVYEEPTGGKRADQATEQHYADETVRYYNVCVPQAGDSSSSAPRYGFQNNSPESPLVYIGGQDLVIPQHVHFEPCPAVVRIHENAKLYAYPTGGDRAGKAAERYYSGRKVTEYSMCAEETGSPSPGTRRYGLGTHAPGKLLAYVDEEDVLIPPTARFGPCPDIVRIDENAKLYQGPTGGEQVGKASKQYFSGSGVRPRDMCVAEGASPEHRRYHVLIRFGVGHSPYVDEKDLFIPPTTRFDPCPNIVHVKEGAALYTGATGAERAPEATERRFSDRDMDSELLCSEYGGSPSAETRRYGFYTGSRAKPFAYVDAEDLVIPSTAWFSACS